MVRPSRLLGVLFVSLAASSARAQPSLAVGDQIDDIAISVRGTPEVFTVIRDANDRGQWYYVPNTPRLFERSFQGRTEPEFALVAYQFTDPKKAGALLEGGVLQFAATLAVPAEVLTGLRSEISKRLKAAKPPEQVEPESVRLSALPIKSAEVHLYTPQSGDFLAGSPHGEGIAPTFATQKMVFALPLTKVGTAVYEELINGNTGVPVVVMFKYQGLTPPAGFRVKFNFKRAHEHYSTDKKFAARASWFGIFGGSADISSKEILDTLKEAKAIDFQVDEGETFKAADAEKYLQPILKRINDEIIEATKPPERINPAEAPAPSAGGWFSAGYSQATVKANYTNEKEEVVSFKIRQSVERGTVASGFIGIGQYPEDLRKKLVTLAGQGPLKSAFFVLPEVGDADALGITQVDLNVALRTGDGDSDSQLRKWSPGSGWTFQGSQASKLIALPLAGVAREDPSLKDLRFLVDTTVHIGGRWSVTSKDVLKGINGDLPVAPPLENFDVIEIDTDACTWRGLDPDRKSRLEQIDVELKTGPGAPFRRAIKPFNKDGKDTSPRPVFWLVPRAKEGAAETPVRTTIVFQAGGERIRWKHNGKDLREIAPSLTLSLTDDDWRPEGKR